MGSAFKLSVSGSGGPTINMRPVGVRREGSPTAEEAASTDSALSALGVRTPSRSNTSATARPAGTARPAQSATPKELQVGVITKILESMVSLINIISSKIPGQSPV